MIIFDIAPTGNQFRVRLYLQRLMTGRSGIFGFTNGFVKGSALTAVAII